MEKTKRERSCAVLLFEAAADAVSARLPFPSFL
jgi:hypothetical protein